ncbi:charged multivesicular body protein 1a [Stylonychia lemnae]|uniref:Charged multivesicular body protein 1a n=1 Tax=Stylonychia lemnae TaxID=5949 RepID=A0A078AHJ8_STYLE|nr:charged multivesicular body protein 1a [Stylonychia lemnae]|eukprot:CDW81719.1 charged multivesicular body protein 1a [Stylonychia lemnae]
MGNEGSKKGGRKRPEDQLFDAAFEMRQQARMLEREAQKVQQQEVKEKAKIAAELKKGNVEFAKIYAETAIRTRKEALNIQRFSAKMSAVASKLDSAYRTQQISQQIKSCVPKLQQCLGQMNKMKISEQMMQFESVFEDLDVKTSDITGALEQVTGSSVQQDEVTQLLQQMQAEHGLEVGGNLVGPGSSQIKQQQSHAQQNDVNDMQRQLDMLKNL